jgi:hypothetical protein
MSVRWLAEGACSAQINVLDDPLNAQARHIQSLFETDSTISAFFNCLIWLIMAACRT